MAESSWVKWGIENWQLGEHWYAIRLRGAAPKLVAIKGLVSASALPLSRSKGFVRQTLVSWTYAGPRAVPAAEIVQSPEMAYKRWQHSVDQNFGSINVKITDGAVAHFPFEFRLPEPVLLPERLLKAKVYNVTYHSKGRSDDPFDAINVEVHSLVEWMTE